MTNKLKNKWVNALTSGDFKQTDGALQDEFGYCCLGVLCEISPNIPFRNEVVFPDDPKNQNNNSIPEKGLKIIGLSDDDQDILIEKNDNGETFHDIADWIQNHNL